MDSFNEARQNIFILKGDGIAIDYFTYASQSGMVKYFVGSESNVNKIDGYVQIIITSFI